jgi:hypothetical protein
MSALEWFCGFVGKPVDSEKHFIEYTTSCADFKEQKEKNPVFSS